MQIEPHVGRNSEVVLDCAPTMHNRVLAQSERAFSPVRDLTHVQPMSFWRRALPPSRASAAAVCSNRSAHTSVPCPRRTGWHTEVAGRPTSVKWPVGPPLSHLGITPL